MATRNFTLSDFCAMPIHRNGAAAEIIVDYFEGDSQKPVRLLGFVADASLTDFEIAEQGYAYYQQLCDVL